MTAPAAYLLIAGSRNFIGYMLMSAETRKTIAALETLGYRDVKIISGMSRGADMLGVEFALMCDVPLIEMPADWDKHGKAAGPIRNREMAKLATHALLFWDGKSRGTKNMIDELEAAGVPYRVVAI